MPMIVTTEIERAALAAGMTERRQLARAMAISPQHLSDLMNGHRRFTPGQLDNVIATLKVSPTVAKRWRRACAEAAGWKI